MFIPMDDFKLYERVDNLERIVYSLSAQVEKQEQLIKLLKEKQEKEDEPSNEL